MSSSATSAVPVPVPIPVPVPSMTPGAIKRKKNVMNMCQSVRAINKSFARYSKLSQYQSKETQIGILVDRMTMILSVGSAGMHITLHQADKEDVFFTSEEAKIIDETHDDIDRIADTLVDQLIEIVKYNKEIETRLKSIDGKLDSVLLGPGYPEGNEMMNESKERFEETAKTITKNNSKEEESPRIG